MTVEERAKKTFDAFMNVHYMELSDEVVMNAITQALRDQIEDCAKIAKQMLDERSFAPGARIGSIVADGIRALAAPTESETER